MPEYRQEVNHYFAFPQQNQQNMVPATGLEPVRCYSLEPESSASANSATRATLQRLRRACKATASNSCSARTGNLSHRLRAEQVKRLRSWRWAERMTKSGETVAADVRRR